MSTEQQVRTALESVLDPEIRRPITELDMVRSVEVNEEGVATVLVALTIAGCPMRETITKDVREATEKVDGVARCEVQMTVMTDEERADLRKKLRGGAA